MKGGRALAPYKITIQRLCVDGLINRQGYNIELQNMNTAYVPVTWQAKRLLSRLAELTNEEVSGRV
jgi:hypothetical protein